MNAMTSFPDTQHIFDVIARYEKVREVVFEAIATCSVVIACSKLPEKKKIIEQCSSKMCH